MHRKPHVIHVVPHEIGGGAERLVCDIQEDLQRRGWSSERIHFCGEPLSGPSVTRFGLRHDSPGNVSRLRRVLRERCSDPCRDVVLHSHLTHGFYAALIARVGLPLRWIHTEHNTTMRLRELRWMRPFERWLYLQCDAVVAISKGVQTSLQTALRLPQDLVHLLQNGARAFGIVQRPPIADRAIRIVSIGSLTKRKGFGVAIRALANAAIGEWTYTIVGEGPDLGSLRSLVQALGLGERVKLAGWSDPFLHLKDADLQLIPSQWEGFGLVAVEGMSTGLRVVASDVAGLREVVGTDREVATLVGDHLDSSAWARELELVVRDLRSQSSPTSAAATERAALFSIEKMVTDHVALYEALLTPRG